jgi:hypothetical protein
MPFFSHVVERAIGLVDEHHGPFLGAVELAPDDIYGRFGEILQRMNVYRFQPL